MHLPLIIFRYFIYIYACIHVPIQTVWTHDTYWHSSYSTIQYLTWCISDKLISDITYQLVYYYIYTYELIQLYYLFFVPCLLQHHKLSFGNCLSAKNFIKIKYSSINCIFLRIRLIIKTILLMLNQSVSKSWHQLYCHYWFRQHFSYLRQWGLCTIYMWLWRMY